jgi:hypothetical protein
MPLYLKWAVLASGPLTVGVPLDGQLPWALNQALGSYYKSCLISSGTPPYPTLGVQEGPTICCEYLDAQSNRPLRYLKARKYLSSTGPLGGTRKWAP